MVKVKLLVARTGGQNAGDIVEVGGEESQRMVAAGQAEVLRSSKPFKAVKASKSEKAVK